MLCCTIPPEAAKQAAALPSAATQRSKQSENFRNAQTSAFTVTPRSDDEKIARSREQALATAGVAVKPL